MNVVSAAFKQVFETFEKIQRNSIELVVSMFEFFHFLFRFDAGLLEVDVLLLFHVDYIVQAYFEYFGKQDDVTRVVARIYQLTVICVNMYKGEIEEMNLK